MGALKDFADHLADMDTKGIGMSIGVPGGEMVPLNETARKAQGDKPARRMAREPSDTPLPLGDTQSRRGVDDRLRLLVERAERLEEEKAGIADDLKDVFAEMKAVGYDTKVVKQVMKLRKMRPDDRRELDTLLDVYRSALGMD